MFSSVNSATQTSFSIVVLWHKLSNFKLVEVILVDKNESFQKRIFHDEMVATVKPACAKLWNFCQRPTLMKPENGILTRTFAAQLFHLLRMGSNPMDGLGSRVYGFPYGLSLGSKPELVREPAQAHNAYHPPIAPTWHSSGHGGTFPYLSLSYHPPGFVDHRKSDGWCGSSHYGWNKEKALC